MIPITPGTLIDALKWRYATKRFDPTKKVSDELWAALEQSLVLAPSSMGIQPWKFLVVLDPALREKLTPASYGQKQITECSHLVVFALRKDLDELHIDKHMDRTHEVRGGEKEALLGYRAMIARNTEEARKTGRLNTWMEHQVYIALGQFLTSAALLGVDTCPMEGIEPAKYDEILGLTGQGYATICACAVGFRADSDKYAAIPKVRFKATDVVSYH
jgi:nitroreductase